MKANKDAFEEISMKKIIKEKKDDFPYYRGNTISHPLLGQIFNPQN